MSIGETNHITPASSAMETEATIKTEHLQVRKPQTTAVRVLHRKATDSSLADASRLTKDDTTSSDSLPVALRKRLEQVFDPLYVMHWWKSPQKRFGGHSPMELYAAGQETRIEEALIQIEEGLPA